MMLMRVLFEAKSHLKVHQRPIQERIARVYLQQDEDLSEN
jgi:hypothetical protein